jgi:hypothetical protein
MNRIVITAGLLSLAVAGVSPAGAGDDIVRTWQVGRANVSSTLQKGDDNRAITVQVGRRNDAETVQNGDGNLARTVQIGNGNTAYTEQIGDGQVPTTVQLGKGKLADRLRTPEGRAAVFKRLSPQQARMVSRQVRRYAAER